MAQNIEIAGAVYESVPSVRLKDEQGVYHPFVDSSDATATAGDIASGKTAYIGGAKVTGTGTQTVVEPLSVTENGTYTASAGHAYSPVTVDVAGGGGEEYPVHEDDYTYFYVEISEHGTKDVYLTLAKSSASDIVYVNWGDGSDAEPVGGGGSSVTMMHTYAAGVYAIKIDVRSGFVRFGGSSSQTVFGNGFSVSSSPAPASMVLRAVELGANGTDANTVGSYSFAYCERIKSIAIKDGVLSVGNRAFNNCTSAEEITMPNSLSTVGPYAFSTLTSLSKLVYPESIGSIEVPFNNLRSLVEAKLPSTVSVTGRVLSSCYSLTKFTVPASITSIESYGLSGLYSMQELHFLATTPPTLANANVFNNLNSDCIFYVPEESVTAYKTANIWSSFASRIVGE